jgi:hypothetical protein
MLALAIQKQNPKTESGNFACQHLPDSVAPEDIDRFCQMIVTATETSGDTHNLIKAAAKVVKLWASPMPVFSVGPKQAVMPYA